MNVYADRDISDACRVLLLLLAEHMTDAGRVSVKRDKLARLLNISERRVTARVTEATRAGLLVKRGGGFQGVTAEYEALLKVAAERPPSERQGGGFASPSRVHLSQPDSLRKVDALRPPNAGARVRASSNATESRDGISAGGNQTSRSPKDGSDEGVGSDSPLAADSPSDAGTDTGDAKVIDLAAARGCRKHPGTPVNTENGRCPLCILAALREAGSQ